MNTNPWPDGFVHEVGGKWQFEDETGALDEEKFDTRDQAIEALKMYARLWL